MKPSWLPLAELSSSPQRKRKLKKPMDPMDTSAATAAAVKKRRCGKRRGNWRKRLHLRKNAAAQPPTMQSQDKCGPKEIADEWGQSKVWPSSKETPREAPQSQRRTSDSENTLRFTCTQCGDNLEYVPRDLVRHFEDKHRGKPPVFPCHACTFNTHEFSCLQIHLLGHKDTFSGCGICNDDVQRTWPEFSAHLTMCHCESGKYLCQMCQRFSTGDVRVFLEHMYAHHSGLERANDDLSPHTKDKNPFGPKPTALRCQHCDYVASQKWLITKHVKAVHVCKNGDQRRKKKKEVHSIAMKTNDPIPKVKPRLTRSAVKEMCWLTQDCLSLPGREFLDKYCHMSDPQTTLEETQQFLMKSVAGETGGQKWTKALQTVLSNVPQDVNLHPKSENGIMSNSSDLTVLTVKNKITVAQNGATYAKRLRRMTTSDKEAVFPESTADDARCIVDQKGCQSNLSDCFPGPQTETKPHNDVSSSAQSEGSECSQMQENRENREFKTDQETEERGIKNPEPTREDVIDISSELKLTNESAEQTPIHKVRRKYKRRIRRRKGKATSKKGNKNSPELPLKIVLKKNPVKDEQWVSQTSSSPSEGDPVDDHRELQSPPTTTMVTAQILQNVPLVDDHQKKWAGASKTDMRDPAEAINPSHPQSRPREELVPSCAAQSVGSKNMDGDDPGAFEGSPSTHQEMRDDAEESLPFSEAGVDERGSAAKAGAVAETDVEMCPENVPLQASASGVDDESSAADGVTPTRSYTKSSPVSQPVITPKGAVNLEDLSLALPLEQSNHGVDRMKDGEVPADSRSDLMSSSHSPAVKAIQQEPSPASWHRWQPVPKHQERGLKLVAINPSQLVKRPAGDQPVVVLNHPDADIPEVARIMEVVNRYRGEVQKVVLSRRTLSALSAMSSEAPETYDPSDVQPDSAGPVKNSVQERFILKLKLRRLSRKKYEVVGAVSPGRDVATKFRCWFCGRSFASQETWMDHRQRHLMEWKRPNCENSRMSHTLDEKQN
ncbi:zinc finger protein 518A isoform X1 [Scophthalmus maximus]|uniref:zinc finger protein 518A isoform X1 n=2 Tax=Scophthalmus maximus TaxID=52904 RepID=UPI001FA82CB2|nr:zinc finger protein 518A isoform X1 [Scophthalmus maximus]